MEMHQKVFGITANAWVAICAIIALVALVGVAQAKEFPLNKAFPDQGVICFDRKAAVAIVDSGAQDAVVIAHLNAGSCFIGKAMTVYTRLVHHKDGYHVYEGTIGKVKIYTPTDWLAEKEIGL